MTMRLQLYDAFMIFNKFDFYDKKVHIFQYQNNYSKVFTLHWFIIEFVIFHLNFIKLDLKVTFWRSIFISFLEFKRIES